MSESVESLQKEALKTLNDMGGLDVNSFTVTSLINISALLDKIVATLLELRYSLQDHEKDSDNQRKQLELKIENLINETNLAKKEAEIQNKQYHEQLTTIIQHLITDEKLISKLESNTNNNSESSKINLTQPIQITPNIPPQAGIPAMPVQNIGTSYTQQPQSYGMNPSVYPNTPIQTQETGTYPYINNMNTQQGLMTIPPAIKMKPIDTKTAWEKWMELLKSQVIKIVIVTFCIIALLFFGIRSLKWGDLIVEANSPTKTGSSYNHQQPFHTDLPVEQNLPLEQHGSTKPLKIPGPETLLAKDE